MIWPAELIWAPGGLGCCPFCGGGSLIVDSLCTAVSVVFVGGGVLVFVLFCVRQYLVGFIVLQSSR